MKAITHAEWQKKNSGKHQNKEAAILGYLEWYVQFLLDNGYHPSRTQRMGNAHCSSSTLNQWESELQGRGLVEIVNRGRLGNLLIIKNVYFVDKRDE